MKVENKNGANVSQFEKIQIEDGWVVVDKEAEILNGDWFIDLRDKDLYWEDIYCAGSGGTPEFANTIGKKIIACSNSIKDKLAINLPEFISKEEQEIENMAKKYLKEYSIKYKVETNDEQFGVLIGFIAGYKANQNKFSDKGDFWENMPVRWVKWTKRQPYWNGSVYLQYNGKNQGNGLVFHEQLTKLNGVETKYHVENDKIVCDYTPEQLEMLDTVYWLERCCRFRL